MENIHKMDLISMGIGIVIGYVIVLAAYSVLTYIQYSVKYHLAKKSVKKYYGELTRLDKIYSREEMKSTGRRMSGGHKR